MTRKWAKSMYYPVDLHARLIYDDPQRTERACSFGRGTTYTGRIGITGARLTDRADKYTDFRVIPRGCVPKTCAWCGNIYPVPAELDGALANENVCRQSCKDALDKAEGVTTQ